MHCRMLHSLQMLPVDDDPGIPVEFESDHVSICEPDPAVGRETECNGGKNERDSNTDLRNSGRMTSNVPVILVVQYLIC